MAPGLIRSLSSELDRYWREVAARGGREVLTFPGSESERLGRALFANLRAGGFCTLLVTGRRQWDCRSAPFEAARAAARRGRKIERAFLLPDRHLRHDKTLKEHVALDDDSGIRTRVLYVGDLIPALAATSPGSLEFGLWDGEICCLAISGPGEGANGPIEWRISARGEDVRRARDMFEILREKAQVVALEDGGGAPPALQEPLVLSAPLAHRVAPGLCRKDPASGEDCAWYHGVWQYLRVLDIPVSPTAHAEFFFGALEPLAREGGYRRVLISGAADYCVPALVLWAYQRQNAVAEVTVVDVCETPLFLSKWYARTVSATVETQASEILDYRAAGPFDVICTHAFLGYFAPPRRRDLIAKWSRLLRPGGKVVTVNPLRPSATEDSVGFTPEQTRVFRETALREAHNWRDVLGVDPDELASMAQRYAERFRSHPVGSHEEIINLFEGGGFTIDHLDSGGVSGRIGDRLSGPTTPGKLEWAQIIAST